MTDPVSLSKGVTRLLRRRRPGWTALRLGQNDLPAAHDPGKLDRLFPLRVVELQDERTPGLVARRGYIGQLAAGKRIGTVWPPFFEHGNQVGAETDARLDQLGGSAPGLAGFPGFLRG